MIDIWSFLPWLFIETVKLFIFSRYILGCDVKKGYLKYFVFIFPLAIILPSVLYEFEGVDILKIIWKLLFVICFFEGRTFIHKFTVFLMESVAITILDISIVGFIRIAFYHRIYIQNENYNLFQGISILVLVLVAIAFRNIRECINRIIMMSDIKTCILIIISVAASTMEFTSLELMMYFSEKRVRVVAVVFSILSTISLVVIATLLMEYKNKKEKAESLHQQTERMMKFQENYYKALLQKDGDIRLFRHDISEHMTALKLLAEEDDLVAIKKYLQGMSIVYETEDLVDTGNKVADFFIGELMQYFKKKENVLFTIIGRFPDEFYMNEASLCTIISNALKNAKEAVDKLGDEKELHIFIEIKNYKDHVYLTIENDCLESEHSFVTSKKTENHGYGMMSIRKAVEQNGGTATWKYIDGKVKLELDIINDNSV